MKTKQLRIVVTQKHRDKAENYSSNRGCILCQAIKSKFGDTTDVVAGGTTVGINYIQYYIDNSEKVRAMYDCSAKFPQIVILTKI